MRRAFILPHAVSDGGRFITRKAFNKSIATGRTIIDGCRGKAALDDDEERIKTEGLILILQELHEKLDRLVFKAYGWPETLTDEEILTKLVALNHECAAEERRGHVRWLRPDYQIPRFGKNLDKQAAKEEGAQVAADLGLAEPAARKPSFPADAVEQTAAVFAALASASGPADADAIATGFRKTKNLEKTISGVLASLARLGHVAARDGDRFEIRRAASQRSSGCRRARHALHDRALFATPWRRLPSPAYPRMKSGSRPFG